MSEDKAKIACHVCEKIVPKAAALTAEGQEYVYHFCNTECLTFWKEKQEKEKKQLPLFSAAILELRANPLEKL